MVVVNGLKANQEERLVVLKTTYHQRVIRHCYIVSLYHEFLLMSVYDSFMGGVFKIFCIFLQENWNFNILKNQHTSLINNYNNKNFIMCLQYLYNIKIDQ